jgi:hypothetical protein
MGDSMNKFIPNSFQVPNVLVDEYITKLSSHSFKLLLFIIRKTKGWQKTKDTIPTTQFAKALGLKKTRHVYPYIAELEALNLIKVHKNLGKTNQYSLGKNFDKPVTKKGSTQTGTSDEKGQYPVTKMGSGTSDEKGHSSKDINKTTINKHMFLNFWERYKGSKREPKTEYTAFIKMHDDWEEILPKFEDVILDNSIDEDYIPKLKNYLLNREWESAKRIKIPQWWETKQGMVDKGKEYGLKELDFRHFQQFRAAVRKEAKEHGEAVA